MSAVHTSPARRELAYRSSNGIDVFLLCCPADDSLAVVVIDEAADSFELSVTSNEALDVFDHPYAHAAFRGIVLAETRSRPQRDRSSAYPQSTPSPTHGSRARPTQIS